MRFVLLATLAALTASPALAQPYGSPPPTDAGRVNVTTAPPLHDPSRYYGERDLAGLATDLASTVQHALAHPRGPAPVAVDLVIEDAKPNRPTFDQLGHETSLSMNSIAIGGAKIGGWATLRDGSRVPVRFAWYESDLRSEYGPSTWSDADRAFDMLAERLSRGDIPQQYGHNDLSRRGTDFGERWPRSRWPQ